VIDKETGRPVIDPETGEVKMREVSNRRNVSFADGREAIAGQVPTPQNQAGLRDVDFHRGGNSGLLQTDCANQQTGTTHRSELQKRTGAIVRAGAKRGVLIDHESTYQAELAKMSAELREAKRTARLEGAALEEDWGSQFAPDRVAQFTIAPSKTGLSAGFFEPDKALSAESQTARSELRNHSYGHAICLPGTGAGSLNIDNYFFKPRR
jgi:hypothetical protein